MAPGAFSVDMVSFIHKQNGDFIKVRRKKKAGRGETVAFRSQYCLGIYTFDGDHARNMLNGPDDLVEMLFVEHLDGDLYDTEIVF